MHVRAIGQAAAGELLEFVAVVPGGLQQQFDVVDGPFELGAELGQPAIGVVVPHQ
jgi:hypothetical protein